MIEIVKYETSWCQPCKQYDKILVSVVESRDDVVLTRIDIAEEDSDHQKYGISSVPYTILRDSSGNDLGGFSGLLPKKGLNKVIDEVKEDLS